MKRKMVSVLLSKLIDVFLIGLCLLNNTIAVQQYQNISNDKQYLLDPDGNPIFIMACTVR